MRFSLSSLLPSPLLPCIIFASTSSLIAQSDVKPQPPVLHAQDGGTSGVMESIFIPPILAAPFTLTLVTEWSRPLPNGGTVTLANKRRIARDGGGRIYQQRWLLVPKGSKIESQIDVIQIMNPHEHTLYNCFVRQKACELVRYSLASDTVYKPSIGVTGPLNNGIGFSLHEDLGVSNSAGLDTTGYRETTTINPGVLGNDQPMVTTREFWYSSHLQINLVSKIDNPQSGKQDFTVRELTTSEPDPKLFDLPEDYKVVDGRKSEAGLK